MSDPLLASGPGPHSPSPVPAPLLHPCPGRSLCCAHLPAPLSTEGFPTPLLASTFSTNCVPSRTLRLTCFPSLVLQHLSHSRPHHLLGRPSTDPTPHCRAQGCGPSPTRRPLGQPGAQGSGSPDTRLGERSQSPDGPRDTGLGREPGTAVAQGLRAFPESDPGDTAPATAGWGRLQAGERVQQGRLGSRGPVQGAGPQADTERGNQRRRSDPRRGSALQLHVCREPTWEAGNGLWLPGCVQREARPAQLCRNPEQPPQTRGAPESSPHRHRCWQGRAADMEGTVLQAGGGQAPDFRRKEGLGALRRLTWEEMTSAAGDPGRPLWVGQKVSLGKQGG